MSATDQPGAERVYHWPGPPDLALWRAPVELPSGLRYFSHTLIVAEGRRGVVVIALRGGELLLVQTFRPSLGRAMWELPRGFGEANVDDPAGAVADGIRELSEETGHHVRNAREHSRYVTDTSVLPSEVSVIVCEVDPADAVGPTDQEAMGSRWVALTAVRALIADGTIADAHSLAALATIADRWCEP